MGSVWLGNGHNWDFGPGRHPLRGISTSPQVSGHFQALTWGWAGPRPQEEIGPEDGKAVGARSLGLGSKPGSHQSQPFKNVQPKRRAYSHDLGAGPNVVVAGEVVGGRGLEMEVP